MGLDGVGKALAAFARAGMDIALRDAVARATVAMRHPDWSSLLEGRTAELEQIATCMLVQRALLHGFEVPPAENVTIRYLRELAGQVAIVEVFNAVEQAFAAEDDERLRGCA